MLLLSLSLLLAAPPCGEITLQARLSARVAEGSIRCTEGTLGPAVAIYPPVLRDPNGYTDINRQWHYPDGFSAADMALQACVGAQCTSSQRLLANGPWQPLPLRTRELRFRTTIPRRAGTFGHNEGSTYLLGGWHPVPGEGEHLPQRHWRYRIEVPPNVVGLVGSHPIRRSHRPQVITGEHTGVFVPVLLAPQMTVDRSGPAVILTPLPAPHLSTPSYPHHLRDLTAGVDEWAREHLMESLALGFAAAKRAGVPRSPLVVVRGPIQENLVELFDGGFMVGRRGFHLLPLERFMKFHRIPVWRAQLATLLMPMVRAREGDPGPERISPRLVSDAVAAALRDRMVRERYHGKETAVDVLDAFAVIPEIDALVFAPQVTFTDAYYEAIDESPLHRRLPTNFYHRQPRGKLLYEKLLDRLGAAEVQRLMTLYLSQQRPWLEVLQQNNLGLDPVSVLAPWMGPYPEVDYFLGEIRHDRSHIEVEVGVQGPGALQVQEPIRVDIEDAEGRVHQVTRLGSGTVRVKAPGPPGAVQLDPGGRLVERVHEPGEAPRLNNRNYERWRFLLNNITGLFAITNGELNAAIDFSLRRIHDLRWMFRFFAVYQPENWGGGLTASYAFGPEITPLKLAHNLGVGFAYERLTPIAGVAPAGHQLSLSLFYRYDSRLSPYWSFEGEGLTASVVGAAAVDATGGEFFFAQLGAAAFKLFPIAYGHALLGRVRADVEIGDAPAQNGFVLGGRYRGGRGYERDEARAKRRILVSGEYRHLYTAAGRTDFLGLLTFTRIEGAFFGDIVNLPVRRPGCQREIFYDVGYGLRFMGEILNVLPATVQIDLGIPLNRCPDEKDRLPFTVYVALLQSFASF